MKFLSLSLLLISITEATVELARENINIKPELHIIQLPNPIELKSSELKQSSIKLDVTQKQSNPRTCAGWYSEFFYSEPALKQEQLVDQSPQIPHGRIGDAMRELNRKELEKQKEKNQFDFLETKIIKENNIPSSENEGIKSNDGKLAGWDSEFFYSEPALKQELLVDKSPQFERKKLEKQKEETLIGAFPETKEDSSEIEIRKSNHGTLSGWVSSFFHTDPITEKQIVEQSSQKQDGAKKSSDGTWTGLASSFFYPAPTKEKQLELPHLNEDERKVDNAVTEKRSSWNEVSSKVGHALLKLLNPKMLQSTGMKLDQTTPKKVVDLAKSYPEIAEYYKARGLHVEKYASLSVRDSFEYGTTQMQKHLRVFIKPDKHQQKLGFKDAIGSETFQLVNDEDKKSFWRKVLIKKEVDLKSVDGFIKKAIDDYLTEQKKTWLSVLNHFTVTDRQLRVTERQIWNSKLNKWEYAPMEFKAYLKGSFGRIIVTGDLFNDQKEALIYLSAKSVTFRVLDKVTPKYLNGYRSDEIQKDDAANWKLQIMIKDKPQLPKDVNFEDLNDQEKAKYFNIYYTFDINAPTKGWTADTLPIGYQKIPNQDNIFPNSLVALYGLSRKTDKATLERYEPIHPTKPVFSSDKVKLLENKQILIPMNPKTKEVVVSSEKMKMIRYASIPLIISAGVLGLLLPAILQGK